MKSFCTAAMFLSCLVGADANLPAQQAAPSLLPSAQMLSSYPVTPASGYRMNWYDPAPSRFRGTSWRDSAGTPTVGDPVPSNGNDPYAAAAEAGWGGDCADCGTDCCDTCPQWFAYVGGLVMTRDRGNKLWTTYDVNNNANQLLNSQDAAAGWRGGWEVGFGGCCGCNSGWEVVYWGIEDMNGEASLRSNTNEIGTPIDVTNGGITIGGAPAADFFDNAREHRLTREDNFHNVEINLLYGDLPACGACSGISWMCGVRYFRFDEQFIFGTLAGTSPPGAEFGDDPTQEAFLDIDIINNLVGFQIGARADYEWHSGWGVFIVPKMGIYGNHMEHRAQLYRGDRALGFDINSTKNDFSFMAQIDLGVEYNITNRWRLFGGYRAVAITGIALADNQVPAFIAAADEFADIDSNGSMILHGGFAGLEYRF